MGLPEPIGDGGRGSRSPCCRDWRLLHHSWAFTSPAPPSPPTPLPAAAFFTTSGYRTLHEFRSQWNYFRILVNRKLRVFHKLSITAVLWEEPGLEASNECRKAPVHCLWGWVVPTYLATPLSGTHWLCSPMPPISTGGSG